MRYAHINADGLVVNVSLWDGESEYTPAEGITLVNVDGVACGPGWSYVDGQFIAPPKPEPDDE
jgi:hypothetical protein